MKKSVLIILLLIYITPTLSWAQATYPFGTIMNRVFQDVTKGGASAEKSAKENLNSLKEDGSWADIDYKSTSITQWSPATHLDRITSMLQAYTSKESTLYADKKLFDGIVKGLQFWYNTDAKSDNWWHNEINVPQTLGVLLIIANYGETKLPQELKTDLLNRMKRGVAEEKTGANKTDIAMHYFYRALLTEDTGLLVSSLKELFEPVQLVNGEEGLQHDFSYLQHGPQLYISGYGAVFISGVLKIANYVKGTPYALSKDKVALFSTFYRDTYLHTIRGNYIDFSVEGRGVSRKGILKKSEKYRLADAKQIDPEHEAEYDAAITRFSDTGTADYGVKPYHQHFWTADYVLHVRPDYTFSVRTSSNRTKRTEAGNNENLYGRYFSDGATNIQVNGAEYFNIMPIWEWDKIPGTTSRNYLEDRLTTGNWGVTGTNEFSGGVSDGTYGATAYELKYDSVSAKKAWFLFDNEIVCLGADINSPATDNITTTINQAWLNGNVNLSDNRSFKSGESANYDAKSGSWIYHANTGYYFPDGAHLSLSTQKQTGNWFKINHSFSKEEVTGDVFKLWIDHGVQPDHGKYAYIVMPAIKNEKVLNKYDPKTIAILSNTAENQAVYHQQLKILQAVFYKPSQIQTEAYSISTDEPCILMLKDGKGDKKTLSIADPLQKETSITLSIKDVKTGKTKVIKVELPTGAYNGATKEVSVDL
ncbi:MAG TPA: chondroitinase-AC [Pelobium sp.]|nr:chondroitinase-AC [Pelobium sp.]